MNYEFSLLAEELQQAILDISLETFRQQHMPISVYIDEMNMKAALLDEHSPIYLTRLKYDVTELENSIRLFTKVLFQQEFLWKSEEIDRKRSLHFWYRNKKKLYDLNRELRKRLRFEYMRLNNSDAVSVVELISCSDDDGDAVDDGRRLKRLLNETKDEIAGGIYSAEEIGDFVLFYERIESARTAALVERTAPHETRILRDKIYLHLRSIEKDVYAAADACFIREPEERRRYVSAYLRPIHKRYNNKRKSSNRSGSNDAESSAIES